MEVRVFSTAPINWPFLQLWTKFGHGIEAAGFKVEPRRVIPEAVSGNSAIEQRPGFMRLVGKLEPEEVLIVRRLDRLERNSCDVATTVERLEKMGVRVRFLALGCMDLTNSAGKMTMGVINSVAQFERDLLERTQAGLERATSAGATFGRPASLDATEHGTSRQTITRARATTPPRTAETIAQRL